MELPSAVVELAERVRDAGGRLYVVGGAVRDHVLGRGGGDIDLEVHGLTPEAVEGLIGKRSTVGKSFGVYRVRMGGELIDVALPQVGGEVRPDLGLAGAARRRDLTLNALAWDVVAGEIVDPHGGLDDLAQGVLRHVDEQTFAEDPLRALRAVRFAVTLDMRLAPELAEVCRRQRLEDVPAERQRPELHKIFGSVRPDRGLELLRELGLLRHLGELGALEPVRLAGLGGLSREDRVVAAWGLLLHGSADRSWVEQLNLGRHAGRQVRKEAEALADALGRVRMVDDSELRRLAETVVVELALPALAALGVDVGGASRRADELGVLRSPLPVLLAGRDLRAAGVEPGPGMGEVLAELREEQICGRVVDGEHARAWLAERQGSSIQPAVQSSSEKAPR